MARGNQIVRAAESKQGARAARSSGKCTGRDRLREHSTVAALRAQKKPLAAGLQGAMAVVKYYFFTRIKCLVT